MRKSFAIACAIVLSACSAKAQNLGHDDTPIRHVLLISIDGMHEVDLLNCGKGLSTVNDGSPYCPNLAVLANYAVNYFAASTSKPSDSFPGLMAIVTGATPRTMGVYYDVSYDRSLDAPARTTGNGLQQDPAMRTQPPPVRQQNMKRASTSIKPK